MRHETALGFGKNSGIAWAEMPGYAAVSNLDAGAAVEDIRECRCAPDCEESISSAAGAVFLHPNIVRSVVLRLTVAQFRSDSNTFSIFSIA